MSMFGTLNIARTGLLAQQVGLNTVSNNISNANTPGYSRQRTVLNPLSTGGVQISGIERLSDEFLVLRMRDTTSRLGARQTLSSSLQQIEAALGSGTEDGISPTIREFFSAWQDLTTKPGGTTERESVRQQGQQLIASFQSAASDLEQLRQGLDGQIEQQVGQVNDLAQQIAKINSKLSQMPQGLQTQGNSEINGLLDQRDELLRQLSEIVPVRTISGADGAMTVFVGSEVLIDQDKTRPFSLVSDLGNDGLQDVMVTDIAGQAHSVRPSLSEGSLGALLEARDEYAGAALDANDQLAAQLLRDVNVQHRAGTGLDGVSGRDFFTGLAVTASTPWTNKGTLAASSTAVLDDTALTFHDYELRFTTAGTYDVVDATSGTTLSTGNAYVAGANIDVAGMRVVLGGAGVAGDVVRFNSYEGTSARMSLSTAVTNDASAIAAGTTSANGDNTNALQIVALGTANKMGSSTTATYEEFADQIRLRVSAAVNAADQGETDETNALAQVTSLVESVSGVSTDDEAISIITYQRAFEASSRVVNVVNDMMETLLNLV